MRILLVGMIVACSETFSDEGEGEGEGEGTQLQDPRDGLVTNGCDDVSGVPITGAVSYYFGELTRTGEAWEGSESWLLYANPSWIDAGYSDCKITWSVTAEEIDTGSCGSCDLSLQISANLDNQETDCPDELTTSLEQFSVQYDVLFGSDGSASWYFSDSGNALAEGYYSDDAMNYLTEHQCVWF